MATELVRNEWGVILRQEELLELRWLPTTEDPGQSSPD